jgi:hypothetical protein
MRNLQRSLVAGALAVLALSCRAPAPERPESSPPVPTPSASAQPAHVGVAAASDGEVCLSIAADGLPPGTPITLVGPDDPQVIVTTSVDQPVDECSPFMSYGASPPFYRLRRAAAAEPRLFVAFVGTPQASIESGGAAIVQFSEEHRRAQIRSCTSTEGLHFTVWSGVPLKSMRLWHSYLYLGLDVEPTCEEGDGDSFPA